MMKKWIYLVLCALIIGAAVFLLIRNKEESSAVPGDQDFAIKDASQVTRVFMADKGNVTVDLKKKDGYWTVNDKYKAMQPKIDVLLETLEKIAVLYPVSKVEWDKVIRELATEATKVEIYLNGEENPSKVYFVGDNTSNSEGTYMLMQIDGRAAKRPYVIHIPGFRGIVNVRYFLDETDWRDTGIFDYDSDQIKEVRLAYTKSPEKSFDLKVESVDSFSIKPLSGNPQPDRIIYKEGVLQYLKSFSFLNAEAYVNDNPIKDSIIASPSYLEISVTNKNSETKTMTVFKMPVTKRTKLQYDKYGNKIPYDLDRYYALINEGKDFVVIQDFVFGKVFKAYSDFFQPKTKNAS